MKILILGRGYFPYLFSTYAGSAERMNTLDFAPFDHLKFSLFEHFYIATFDLIK